MITAQDIIDQLNTIAPFNIAETWDNSGLQVGNPDWKASKILVALDVTFAVMTEAVQTGSNLVLTHHPLMMSPEKSIDFRNLPGSVIEISAKQRISVVSAHTNLDKAAAGLNDYFSAKIGLTHLLGPLSKGNSPVEQDQDPGIGRLAELESQMTLEQFVYKIKARLGLEYLRVTGPMDLPVKKIAVCTGSGGSLLSDFLNSGADVYVTGDVKYHEARKVEEYSKGLIDVGHFSSEQIAIDLLCERLKSAFDRAGLTIEVVSYKKEKDPFTIF